MRMRDNWTCQEDGCGVQASETHHIAPLGWFGKNNKHLAWQEKNMIVRCPKHHIPFAHTKRVRKHDVEYLRDRYGYDYSTDPWTSKILGWTDD